MANSTSLVLFQSDDPFDAKTKGVIAVFLAGYGGATLRSYRTDLRIFAEWCVSNRIAVLEVKRAHIEIFGREMESAGKMRSTVARLMSTIAGFFKYCHDEGLLDRNPAANIRRPKVDHESRTLGFGSQRAPRTGRSLDLYIGERTTGPIFVGAKGRRMDRNAADRMVKRLSKRAGVNKRISPHSLRHSFITSALDAGVPLRDVQESVSHADPRTTMRYDRARQSLDRHAIYIVAAFVAGAARVG